MPVKGGRTILALQGDFPWELCPRTTAEPHGLEAQTEPGHQNILQSAEADMATSQGINSLAIGAIGLV
jgi:hypothetical protein